MQHDSAQLLDKLRAFSFDEPNAPRPFSQRLAEEQGWSPAFTRRAIEEYRRFVVLVMTAGRTVCPSDEVDEVWHLHLLYTRNYWHDFCQNTLGQPLHHEPSRGGTQELARHRQMYRDTLAAYRQVFGEEPPVDLWPPLEQRFAEKPTRSGQAWPRRAIARRSESMRRWPWVVSAGVTLPLLVALDAPLSVGAINPLEMRGVEFLVLYVLLFMVAFVGSIWLRRYLRGGHAATTLSTHDLDPYEMAYLAGGMRRTINTALAELVHRGHLESDGKTPPTFAQRTRPGADSHAIEQKVYHSFDGQQQGGTVQTAQRDGDAYCETILQKLREAGLVVSSEANWLAVLIPLSIFMGLTAFGYWKISVGMSRERPIGFLVTACVITLLVGLVGFTHFLHRTVRGDRHLESLRSTFANVRDEFKQQHQSDFVPTGASTAAYPLVLGLFGLDLLRSTPHSDLAQSLGERAASSGSGCSSGCGGSGCGGGGCGGGCGGCGGGD
ncbi:MAG: TIGR04222 domain-containing membrane protein [Pirellulales bacterium]|nr:TIGR04222 domain-containing membrane protein [Pirellulales bacterium]